MQTCFNQRLHIRCAPRLISAISRSRSAIGRKTLRSSQKPFWVSSSWTGRHDGVMPPEEHMNMRALARRSRAVKSVGAVHLVQLNRTIRDRIKHRREVIQEACETLAVDMRPSVLAYCADICSRMEALLRPRRISQARYKLPAHRRRSGGAHRRSASAQEPLHWGPATSMYAFPLRIVSCPSTWTLGYWSFPDAASSRFVTLWIYRSTRPSWGMGRQVQVRRCDGSRSICP